MTDTARDAFDDPFTEQREMREPLGQETRHLIIQCILGRPLHLA